MSDGIAPAIDKVGSPAPNAPEAEAGAPTLSLSEAPPAPTSAAPADEPNDKTAAIPDGAGPALSAPKPVEVKSVPETPLDNNTPAGGTPRPELNLSGAETPAEPTVTTGVQSPKPTATVSAPENGTAEQDVGATSAVNGGSAPADGSLPQPSDSPSNGAVGSEKRKLDETTDATNGAAPASVGDVDEPADKKVKTNGGTPPKAAKIRKDKVSPPGKTARKTRSQGPVEV
jgi:hypothetical protein